MEITQVRNQLNQTRTDLTAVRNQPTILQQSTEAQNLAKLESERASLLTRVGQLEEQGRNLNRDLLEVRTGLDLNYTNSSSAAGMKQMLTSSVFNLGFLRSASSMV